MSVSYLFPHDHIQIVGNTDVYFNPCKRLLECSELLMRVQTAKHTVDIWGEHLTATDFGKDGLHIEGKIATIELDGGLQ